MRLTPTLVEQTLSQFEAEAIPDDHPAMAKLNRLFGDHTFFIDSHGLNIVEPADSNGKGVQEGYVLNLASWSEADPPKLEAHEPETTDIVVTLGPMH